MLTPRCALGLVTLAATAAGGCASAAPSGPSSATPAPEVADVAPPPPPSALPPRPDPGLASAADAGDARDAHDARATGSAPLVTEKLALTAPRFRSPVLDGPPRPSRLAPGAYACRVDRTYRLRPCTVSKDASGHTRLEAPGGLVELTGVLYDDGPALVFEGTMAEERPFGCFSCQERCSASPGACACVELPPEASRACLAQPLRVRFSAQAGGRRVGTLAYDTYMNRYVGSGEERHPEGADVTRNAFVVEIAPASALPRTP